MHILIIPSWYPSPQNRINGIFFQEQAKSIAKFDKANKVGVVSATFTSITKAFKSKNFSYGTNENIQDNFSELIFNFPAIPKNNSINRWYAQYMCKKMFLAYIEKNGLPDIIHLHSFNMGELVLWIKEEYNIPFIYTEHAAAFYRNNVSSKEKKVVSEIISEASYNFAVSQQLSKFLSQKFEGKVEMLPNFIDTNFFQCNEKKDNDTFTFINIAGLTPNKNHELLLNSFKKINTQYANTKLVIYGDGAEKDTLLKLKNKLGLADQVKLGGQISRNKVKEQLCMSDCFILTSKVETFGVVAIEAMSCGLPVISTKNGGAESIITSDTVGILCDQTEDAIFNAMKKIYLNKGKYDGQVIRKFAINSFSEEAIVKRIISVYVNVVKSNKI